MDDLAQGIITQLIEMVQESNNKQIKLQELMNIYIELSNNKYSSECIDMIICDIRHRMNQTTMVLSPKTIHIYWG
jgi:hypothetical protein